MSKYSFLSWLHEGLFFGKPKKFLVTFAASGVCHLPRLSEQYLKLCWVFPFLNLVVGLLRGTGKKLPGPSLAMWEVNAFSSTNTFLVNWAEKFAFARSAKHRSCFGIIGHETWRTLLHFYRIRSPISAAFDKIMQGWGKTKFPVSALWGRPWLHKSAAQQWHFQQSMHVCLLNIFGCSFWRKIVAWLNVP